MKCKYCGKECFSSFCSTGCEKEYGSFKKKEAQTIRKMIGFLLASFSIPFVVIITSLIWENGLYTMVGCGLLLILPGMVVICFPFATDETIKIMSLKKAIMTVRCCGVVMLIIGCAIALLGLV